MNKRIKSIVLIKSIVAILVLLGSFPALATESVDYSIARGGRLYDKWFKENGAGTPDVANPAYPDSGKYKGKKGADWRCKECHGWDYLGNKGAYKSGKHFTGFPGVSNSSRLDSNNISEILKNDSHKYDPSVLTENDINDLTNFLIQGQIDMSSFVDRKSNKATGDPIKGKTYFETLCVSCHGMYGKKGENPPLGKLSNKNPWEVLHKILNGQPSEQMPALRSLDMSISVDILSYMQQKLP